MADLELEQLHEELDRHHLKPLWRAEASVMPAAPCPRAVPWLWRWSDLFPLARRAGELVTLTRGGDRRAMGLANPGLGGLPHATPTLWAAVQWLNGREVAPSHRHSAQAVRFIIDGRDAFSTVEGDKVLLERGDFVLNPPWHWHDHGSDGDGPAIWMDGLDVPLNNYLNTTFFEPDPRDAQPVTAVRDGSVLKYGIGQYRPAWEPPCRAYSPLSTYKWVTTERALSNLAKIDASRFDDVALEYINPHSGGPVLETITAWIQLLRPGVHTKAHRQVNSAVYHVFEGVGATVIDGVQFEWERGDIFVIPVWAWHEHLNRSRTERALLFSIQDTPVMTALGKYREEALTTGDGYQAVRETFDAGKVLA